MGAIAEIVEDLSFLIESLDGSTKQEFIFAGTKGPVIQLHGVGGGWNKEGQRQWMNKSNVCGTLNYFGDMKDGLDNYIGKVDEIIKQYDETPIIVGWSAGGLLALRYAEKYGWNKIKKVITVATPLFGSPPARYLKGYGETYEEISPDSNYLNKILKIKPPEDKVLSIFAESDIKAPFKNVQTLNWSVVIVDAKTHGEIHSNYKIIEKILDAELKNM